MDMQLNLNQSRPWLTQLTRVEKYVFLNRYKSDLYWSTGFTVTAVALTCEIHCHKLNFLK